MCRENEASLAVLPDLLAELDAMNEVGTEARIWEFLSFDVLNVCTHKLGTFKVLVCVHACARACSHANVTHKRSFYQMTPKVTKIECNHAGCSITCFNRGCTCGKYI